jgi:hypothetical protein
VIHLDRSRQQPPCIFRYIPAFASLGLLLLALGGAVDTGGREGSGNNRKIGAAPEELETKDLQAAKINTEAVPNLSR